MSISAALNSAASGLNAAGRAAQVVSGNVANALTPGYAARQIERTSTMMGGVEISAIGRRETLSLITDRRMSDAAIGAASVQHDAMSAIARAVGAADDPASLAGRFSSLSARLIEAQSRPDSDIRLSSLQGALGDLVGTINRIGQAVQNERLAADTAIATSVQTLNATLQQVDDLNVQIVSLSARGQDVNALLDQRRLAIDRISDLVPVREIPRQNGRIALITETGKLVLDSSPVEFSFTRTNGMAPTMVKGAPLSGLEIGGRPIDAGAPGGPIAGGKIAALFALRDDSLPRSQTQIDSVARDLIERFQDAGVDPTVAPGAPGLLTDNGVALGVAPVPGLAQRLSLNAAVDPARGGALYRLRDGLGSSAPGNIGDASLLNSLAEALDARSPPSDTALTSTVTSAGGLIDTLLSTATAAVFRAELTVTESRSRHEYLLQAELSEGVNTDEEMRTLLLVEQSYAANARVIEVAGSMIQRILEI